MFRSGPTPFPREHWSVLAPAMREQARRHAGIAGHRPYGPFKHFWGEAQRLVYQDNPFSLWLAAGVRFEAVAESLPALFAFKQRIKSQLREVPHVEEDEPTVCAW